MDEALKKLLSDPPVDKQARDRFLTETVLGDCWHEAAETRPYHDGATMHLCRCGVSTITGHGFVGEEPKFCQRHDFSSWEGYGTLRERVYAKWPLTGMVSVTAFWNYTCLPKGKFDPNPPVANQDYYLNNPGRFADALYLFLQHVVDEGGSVSRQNGTIPA